MGDVTFYFRILPQWTPFLKRLELATVNSVLFNPFSPQLYVIYIVGFTPSTVWLRTFEKLTDNTTSKNMANLQNTIYKRVSAAIFLLNSTRKCTIKPLLSRVPSKRILISLKLKRTFFCSKAKFITL